MDQDNRKALTFRQCCQHTRECRLYPRIRYNRSEERHPDPPASGTGLSYAKEIAVWVRHSTHLGPVFPSVCESLSGRLTPTIGPVGQNEGPTKARLCFLGKQPKPVIARPHVQAFRSLYWCKPSEGSALRQPHPPLTVGSEGHRAGVLPAPGVEAYLVDRSGTIPLNSLIFEQRLNGLLHDAPFSSNELENL